MKEMWWFVCGAPWCSPTYHIQRYLKQAFPRLHCCESHKHRLRVYQCRRFSTFKSTKTMKFAFLFVLTFVWLDLSTTSSGTYFDLNITFLLSKTNIYKAEKCLTGFLSRRTKLHCTFHIKASLLILQFDKLRCYVYNDFYQRSRK